jgi:hypothetical protein
LLHSSVFVFCIHITLLALVAVSSTNNMKFITSSAAVAAFAVNAAAQTVSGAAEGFAAGVTGGGVRINVSKMLPKF